jgi:PqqD family protein of HPr-rel-A system
MPRSFPKARDELTIVHLDGESVVYVEASGDLHHLNTTATAVLDLCDGTSTIAELATAVAEAFDMPFERIEPDVRSLLRQLRRADLLEPSGARRSRAARS